MTDRHAVSCRTAVAALLAGVVGLAAPAAAPAASVPSGADAACSVPATPPEECSNPLPQVLNVGLPYMEGLSLEELEGSLRTVIEDPYRQCRLCPDRPLRINVALGSDYQILDWLDRGLVDMGVVPVLGLHLLRRDGIDLVEIVDPRANEMAQLVDRVPALEETEIVDGVARTVGRSPDALGELARRLWRWTASAAGSGTGSAGPVPDPGHLVMPSHLSTAGFLIPVLAIEDALDDLPAARGATPEERSAFWRAFYQRVCFRFGPRLGRRDGEVCEATPGSPRLEVVVLERSRADAEVAGPPSVGWQLAYRDRLVVRRGAMDSVFSPGTFPVREPPAWDEIHRLGELLARTMPVGESEETVPVPSAFDDFLVPDGYFGTRTFAFRVGETLDLLELHQRIASRPNLSLVLPGGGVKAAYQSRVLDQLYGTAAGGPPRLRNAGAGPAAEPRPAGRSLRLAAAPPGGEPGPGDGDPAGAGSVRPLQVDSVVGTSGGALLGFFVARLGPRGPGNLSSVLWQPDPDGEPERYVTATEIFGWTDLPRYVSLVLILCIFGLVLAPFSWRRRGFLAPHRRPAAERVEEEPAVRWPVLGVVLAVLVLTPLVVSWVSDQMADEHVPEFEGLLYAVLLVLATFADQCLVRRGDAVTPARREAHPSIGGTTNGRMDLRTVLPVTLLTVGGLLVLAPVLVRLLAPGLEIGGESLLEGRVSTGSAYLVLGSMTAGVGLLAVGWRRLSRLGWWNLLAWPSVFVVGTLAAWLILRAVGVSVLGWVDRTPLLFLALALALVLSVMLRLVRSEEGPGQGKVLKTVRRVSAEATELFLGHRLARFVGLGAVAFLGCLVVLDLTRPPAEEFVAAGFRELLAAESKLDAPRGPLAVCLGAVFVLLGTILVLHRRPNGYHLELQDRFRDAVLVVVTGLAFAVYGILLVVVALVGWIDGQGWLAGSAMLRGLGSLTLFELTPSFWIGLAVASVLGSVALIAWARKGDREDAGAFSRMVTRSLAFLCAIHPNAHLVPRRVVRLGLMSIGGLVWWNFVLAPALYGNRYAFDYMVEADRRFAAAYQEVHADSSYRLTARYLAPANALVNVDGTRFVLAVRDGEDCPAVPASPGVIWRRFRIVGPDDDPVDDDCTELQLGKQADREELQNYIFASGSPFPAFPPKRVRTFDGELEEREALVDGGYSNNVPIEAASKIGARQALVIHSSNPRPETSGGGWLAALGGPLVDNVPRLLGFLYERSQQLDRRSRSDLFVVSLAPPPADDWPILTDFREATVKRMIRRADEHLAGRLRIGMVESWGPPEFQSSLRVPEEG